MTKQNQLTIEDGIRLGVGMLIVWLAFNLLVILFKLGMGGF